MEGPPRLTFDSMRGPGGVSAFPVVRPPPTAPPSSERRPRALLTVLVLICTGISSGCTPAASHTASAAAFASGEPARSRLVPGGSEQHQGPPRWAPVASPLPVTVHDPWWGNNNRIFIGPERSEGFTCPPS
ncbi:hypothetical protein NDU88_001181 [Pleurodeles waltl]|uniref:Uncharacterized protein n=1 Tax=Pleurodeles waltl TaxID=8319 RepID=A0AAV7U8L2_PLEWA|nr:hypothetical protein NDU88_001181 [Pleurodeles waltl]